VLKKRLLICSPSLSPYGGVEIIIAGWYREPPKRGWDFILGLGSGALYNKVSNYSREDPDLSIVEIDGTKETKQARLESLKKLTRNIGNSRTNHWPH